MKKYVSVAAVIASSLLLSACGVAQSDERSDRRDRSEERSDSRGDRDDRDSGRDRDERSGRDDTRRERDERSSRDDTRRDRASGSEERPTSARDATNQNFVLRNNTGQTIMRVFVSPVTSNNWEEDVLGANVLPDRRTLRINFNRAEDECSWDIKVDLEDGTSREQRNMNLCRLGEVEVTG